MTELKAGREIVLDADVYDTLELMAWAFGGIGGGKSFVDLNGWRNQPLCALGHATFATDIPFENVLASGSHANPIAQALFDAGIWGARNDDAVQAINRRHGAAPNDIDALWKRVSWEEYCSELNIVRGATVSQGSPK